MLQEAKELNVPAVWLQPGTFDDAVLKFAREEYGGEVVAGEGGRGSHDKLGEQHGEKEEEGNSVVVDVKSRR